MKVYVASSWRNQMQPEVVLRLREARHEVYDFRHPMPGNKGFAWSEIDPNWQSWSQQQYLEALQHPAAGRGFKLDMRGLNWCEANVLVLPCGRSAHLEAGYSIGQRKPTKILLAEGQEPELMYKMAAACVTSIDEVLAQLEYAARYMTF